MSMVFQNYALYPNMTVYGNMAYALKIRKLPKDEIDRKVHEVAKILELKPGGMIVLLEVAWFVIVMSVKSFNK